MSAIWGQIRLFALGISGRGDLAPAIYRSGNRVCLIQIGEVVEAVILNLPTKSMLLTKIDPVI